LFISMRMAASCCHPRQVIVEPRGARTTRVPAGAPGIIVALTAPSPA
jgi:hypothetical protein